LNCSFVNFLFNIERTRQESRWENKDVGQSQNLSSTTRDDRSHIKNSPQQRGRRSARKQALWDRIQENIRVIQKFFERNVNKKYREMM